jgi:hypothetical protein
MSRMNDPMSVKFEKPTVKSLKQRAKREQKPISQLIREMVVLALAKSPNGRK